MISKTIIKRLTGELRKLSGTEIDVEEVENRYKNMEKLDSFLQSGPVVCSIFNHVTFKYDYLSPNIDQMLGISVERLMSLDDRDVLKLYFHPGDLQVVTQKLFPDVLKFISQKAKNDIASIYIHYNYRMRTVAGDWIKVEQQTSPIKSDEAGNILLDQSFYTQVEKAEYKEINPIELSIFVKNANGLYDLKYSQTYTLSKTGENGFTQRELEVLTLLAKGKTSSQIGQTLFISESTVVTHRKNMLEKFDLNNTSELIAYAFKSGIL